MSVAKNKVLGIGLAISFMLLFNLITPFQVANVSADTQKTWVNTGISLNKGGSTINCFDGSQPNTVLVSNGSYYESPVVGTYAYNYVTGDVKQISSRNLVYCNEDNGLLYNYDFFNTKTGFKMGSNPNEETPLNFQPTAMAADGTLKVFGIKDGRLYYSADGGKTVQERGQQFSGKFLSVTTAAQDARTVYAVIKGVDLPPIESYNLVPFKYAVYISNDMGVNWQKGFESQTDLNVFNPEVQMLGGKTTPVNWVIYMTHSGYSPSSSRTSYNLSTDGGKTFREIGFRMRDYSFQFYHTSSTIIRLRYGIYPTVPDKDKYQISFNGGVSWNSFNFPFEVKFGTALYQAKNAPNNLFSIEEGGKLWYSNNGGIDWAKIADMPNTDYAYSFFISPYAPTTLLTVKDKQIYRLDLPEVDHFQTIGTDPNNANNGGFYTETRHNMSPLFRNYWDSKGGLAQFGYPRTEAIREFNPSDGKIYTVQYYERNRFEYHPENVGSPYEILLGLLGNQLTETRRNQGEQPFKRVDPPINQPNIAYFPLTGHTLSNSFRDYWEANGGLSIYGYPISEEFKEVNPDDGKTYTVQYFERNRFEYHPENKDTKYEVLLGLLGNSLLRIKGWPF
jgi:hypothetical protein